jgi:hypothetical protein
MRHIAHIYIYGTGRPIYAQGRPGTLLQAHEDGGSVIHQAAWYRPVYMSPSFPHTPPCEIPHTYTVRILQGGVYIYRALYVVSNSTLPSL